MESKKRYIEYDLMRIVACFCVIMIHCAVFEQETLFEYTTFEFQAIKIWGVLARWAVPIFVMLSGLLILPNSDKESIVKLMKHRVIRMICVFIAWSSVYSFYNVYVLDIIYAPTKIKTFIDGCFSGEIHMWYIPMLTGLYLISPLLAIIIKNANEKWTKYWLLGLFVFSSIIPFIVKLDIKFASTIIGSVNSYMDLQFLGGWTLYFVLGYYIQNHDFSRQEKRITYICSFVGLVYTMYASIIYCLKYGEPFGVLSYEYPNIVMFSIGILLFFKEKISAILFSETIKRKIYSLSKLTFGIYLIHVLMLKLLYFGGINVQMCHPIISVPFVSFIVFASSAAVIWCIRKIPVIGTYLA